MEVIEYHNYFVVSDFWCGQMRHWQSQRDSARSNMTSTSEA